MSDKAKQIIKLFLSDKEKRLGRNGVDEIKSHPFFTNSDWNWENLRSSE